MQQEEEDQLATTVVQTARLGSRTSSRGLVDLRSPAVRSSSCLRAVPARRERAGGGRTSPLRAPTREKTRERKKRTIQALFVAAAEEI